MVDLHVHTTASDGLYSPSQIAQKANEQKISTIAITDHDTIDGLEEGTAAGKKFGINVIPGVELNIGGFPGEFHLLGLGIRNPSESLKEILRKTKEHRNFRNEQIIQKMRQDGIDICIDDLKSRFPNTIIGRPHIAATLVEKKIVKTTQAAFYLYLAKGKPYYIERIFVNLDEAIIAVKESGGVAVAAHPMSLFISWGKMPEVFQNFYERGIDGIEAFHPGARVTECLRLEELAKKTGFFVTAGSDFHGEKIRPDRKLGYTCGRRKIDERFWENELKPALEKTAAAEF